MHLISPSILLGNLDPYDAAILAGRRLTGAIVLVLGYKLFQAWVNVESSAHEVEVP